MNDIYEQFGRNDQEEEMVDYDGDQPFSTYDLMGLTEMNLGGFNDDVNDFGYNANNSKHEGGEPIQSGEDEDEFLVKPTDIIESGSENLDDDDDDDEEEQIDQENKIIINHTESKAESDVLKRQLDEIKEERNTMILQMQQEKKNMIFQMQQEKQEKLAWKEKYNILYKKTEKPKRVEMKRNLLKIILIQKKVKHIERMRQKLLKEKERLFKLELQNMEDSMEKKKKIYIEKKREKLKKIEHQQDEYMQRLKKEYNTLSEQRKNIFEKEKTHILDSFFF